MRHSHADTLVPHFQYSMDNKLIGNADDSTVIGGVWIIGVSVTVAESLNRDLGKVG